MSYLEIFLNTFGDYWRYLLYDVTTPSWHSAFYGLVGVSVVFYAWELIAPWRKDQPKIRKDFWLDAFYMFFNMLLFGLIGFAAVSNVAVQVWSDLLQSLFGIENIVALHVGEWPVWLQLGTLFVLRDFIHWNVHRLLHRTRFLWQFHKVHHSVEQMGFAAHLRFHWMESVVYRVIEYLGLALVGFGLDDYFMVYLVSLAIGHWNHANIVLPLGPLKYILNGPQMHIWHHATSTADRGGVNFGLSLSCWDYLFGSAYVPRDGRDEVLGFDEIEAFPSGFVEQALYPLEVRRRHR